MRRASTCLLGVLALTWAEGAVASENGQSQVDLGYLDTLAGLPLAPGVYARDDVDTITSSQLNNGNGDPVRLNLGNGISLPVKFRQTTVIDVVAGAYVPAWKVPYLDATIGSAFYIFSGNSRVGLTTELGVPEQHAASKGGLGDLTVVPVFLGFDIAGTPLHIVVSPLEFTAPTGRYDPRDPSGNNLGTNHWSWRPGAAFTYINKTGQEVDLNVGFAVNSTNPATAYRSGSEFDLNYAAQQYLSRHWALGVGGYYYRQFTDDTVNGRVVYASPLQDPLGFGAGNRGETFAYGPILTYDPRRSLSFEAHWDHEAFSYDRSQRDQIWLRGLIKF